jgi:membrane protease YdiL (CAAX protease family)
VLGLVTVWLIFDRTAAGLGSDRGQAGLAVGAVVVLATLGIEIWMVRRPIGVAAGDLGLGPPAMRGLLVATTIGLLLLLVLPVFAAATGSRLVLTPGWGWLVPGLFAQAGIAEEVLFRGYLFRHLRQGRSFARAAILATGPFAAVHLLLLLSMPWPVALAAIVLAIVLSFPLAHLFELGGDTIWPPALVHFVVQGAIKVIDEPGELLPVAWMAASAALPLLVFLVPRPPTAGPAVRA